MEGKHHRSMRDRRLQDSLKRRMRGEVEVGRLKIRLYIASMLYVLTEWKHGACRDADN
jgi:hypothetical protein